MWRAVTVLALAAACGDTRGAAQAARLAEDDSPAPIQVIGVSPLDFRCDLVANVQDVADAVGAPVELTGSGFREQAGLAKPCHYGSTAPERPGAWSFDLDCREHTLESNTQHMAQIATGEGARPVLVGRTGVDHGGVQLLFVDDDTPCYVRIMGKGEAERLALARLVADGLVRTNAPGRVTFRE